MFKTSIALLCAALAGAPALASSTSTSAPVIPEPLVFDMVRSLGAEKGELEANVLALAPLSGQPHVISWAPEVEYAFARGHAIEFELPFENGSLAEFKLGLQGTFGTLNNGRAIHGWQYLGVYDRHDNRVYNTLLYIIGQRFDERWSALSTIGFGEISPGFSSDKDALLINHSTFYDVNERSVAGVEMNVRSGGKRSLRVTPQWHQKLSPHTSLQFGLGVHKARFDVARPEAAARLIKEF
ncbi:hypothetical protein [Blastomonas sp.]|uniref:hypothetical protein n=1 Tax=Blastomonas sp. TaxID=1909299 RepID=UPI0039197C66